MQITEGLSEEAARSQLLSVSARWIVVAAGLIFTLWHPGPIADLRLQLLILFLLAAFNFYLHTQFLMRRQVPYALAFGASAADVLLVTILVISQGGFPSGFFLLYLPAVLVFSAVFSTKATLQLTIGAMLVYALVVFGSVEVGENTLPIIIMRLVTLAAVAACGHLMWRIRWLGNQMGLGLQPGPRGAYLDEMLPLTVRWSVIVSTLAVVLWTATDESVLPARILPIMALMAVNFYLHGRYVAGRTSGLALPAFATLLDLALITGFILMGPEPQGIQSPFFVLYYPVVLASALAFPLSLSVGITLVSAAVYAVACALAGGSLPAAADLGALVERIIILAAVGALGITCRNWWQGRSRLGI